MSHRRFRCDWFQGAIDQPISVAPQCFSDETAIDFPSVARFAERARDAFLGEPGGATLTANVLLSTRDAWTGAIVPLDVPLRWTCSRCGGRGETWTEPCPACRGTGDSLTHYAVQVPVPPRVADGARLRFHLKSPHVAPVRIEVRVVVRSPAT